MADADDLARAEAERRWPHTGDANADTARAVRRLTWVQAAAWQREQPTAVTADQVGVAARAAWPGLFANRFAKNAQQSARDTVREILAALGIEVTP